MIRMKPLIWWAIGAAVGGLSIAAWKILHGRTQQTEDHTSSTNASKMKRSRSYKEDGVILNADGSSDTPID